MSIQAIPWYLIVTALLWLGLTPALQAQNKTIYMTSLEWPPYSGAKLPQQGVTIAASQAIFNAMGYDLVVDFYPWSRAVRLGLDKESKYQGYFPEYYSDELSHSCHFSEAVGSGPLGFAQLKSQPVKWQSLDDIAKLSRVGIVQDLSLIHI